MKLYTTLSEETVFIGVSAPDKEALLQDLVQRMAEVYSCPNRDQLIEIILEREAEISTGIGGGVAIPHANQAPVEETMLAAATLASPLEYNAIDGQPVQLIFLVMTGSGKAGLHLKILARISRMSHKLELLQRLIDSATPAEFLQHLSGFEDRFTDINT
jgi:mannitol/fructose-specific phosphotransferase system IIA component (Ntr-type)